MVKVKSRGSGRDAAGSFVVVVGSRPPKVHPRGRHHHFGVRRVLEVQLRRHFRLCRSFEGPRPTRIKYGDASSGP